jgi:hypothetical protein
MEVYETYTDLEQIRLAEKHKYLFNGYLVYTSIETTKQAALIQTYKIAGGTTEKQFHPSWFRRILILLIFGFVCFWWITLVNLKTQDDFFYLVSSPLFIIAAYGMYDGYFNKQVNFRIHLDFTGITIADELYKWADISKTGILQIGSGRNRKYYLILLLHDGSYRKFSLKAFLSLWGFKDGLSTYIEYFKNTL